MLTIVIATKNRSEFMARLLNYYADTNYRHWIYVGDSSDSSHFECTKDVINQLKGRLKVRIYKYPDLSGQESLNKLLEMITTPYVVYIGDDDFLVTSGLQDCIEFLENNKEYTGANGRGVAFSLRNYGPKGQFQSLGGYRQRAIEADTAVGRLLLYFERYFVTVFSVQRLSVWKTMYKDVFSIPDRALAGEFLPCCLSVIQGKIKHLNCFYLLRQTHGQRDVLPNAFDWITDPKWFLSYEALRSSLIQALIEKDCIDRKQADRIVKQVFWGYLKGALSTGYERCYGGGRYNLPIRIKKILKRIPGMSKTVNNIKSVIFPSRNLSLPVLLNRWSAYHADFMPVYRAIIKK